MVERHSEIDRILSNASDALFVAERSLHDLRSVNPVERELAVRNFVVTSRTLPTIIQNLKNKVPRFKSRYQPHIEKIGNNPRGKNFIELRNQLEKRGETNLFARTTINGNIADAIAELGTPPPNVVGTFLGDDIGGSGWIVSYGAGTYKVYSTSALQIARTTLHFENLTKQGGNGSLDEREVLTACEGHFVAIKQLVDDAIAQFATASDLRGRLGKRMFPVWLKPID